MKYFLSIILILINLISLTGKDKQVIPLKIFSDQVPDNVFLRQKINEINFLKKGDYSYYYDDQSIDVSFKFNYFTDELENIEISSINKINNEEEYYKIVNQQIKKLKIFFDYIKYKKYLYYEYLSKKLIGIEGLIVWKKKGYYYIYYYIPEKLQDKIDKKYIVYFIIRKNLKLLTNEGTFQDIREIKKEEEKYFSDIE